MPDYFEPEMERTYGTNEATLYQEAVQTTPIASSEEVRQTKEWSLDKEAPWWLDGISAESHCLVACTAKVVRKRLLQSASA